jgi:uncharacterized membrane protein
MKTARKFFLLISLVGFLFSLIIHLLSLWDRAPSSEYWFVVPFLGAFVSWIAAAYLSGAKAGRMGLIPISEVVKDCPTWLKRINYFFCACTGLIFLWVTLRALGLFHWRKVELPAVATFVVFSTFSMMFYVDSFSMLFGKLCGETRPG